MTKSLFPELETDKKSKKTQTQIVTSCYCSGTINEWKTGPEVYLQCNRCQMRTPSFGDSEKGRDLLYHFWNNRPEIKK